MQMASSCIGWTPLLLCLVELLLLHLHTHAASASSVHPHGHGNLTRHSAPLLCRPDQPNILLKLKQSFSFHPNAWFPDDLESITTLPSWQAGTDCCLWEGVGCSNSSLGHVVVTALDLSGFQINSNGIHPVLFNLTSLRLLDLRMNNFRYHDIPSLGFERLRLLRHLNLSTSGINGQVPIGISKLKNLVSLDLSNRGNCTDYEPYYCAPSSTNFLWVRRPNFGTLVENLSNLRELYLDDAVTIYSPAEDCFKALAKSVPHLRVLSLESCGLQGHIDNSLSRLKSLAVINLSENLNITSGPFPEFLMNFPNLRVLQLSDINLQGWLPPGMFLSKDLRVLDLSWNLNLSGHVPSFSNVSSLETLFIDWTNFTCVSKSSYFSHSKALAELGIDGKIISADFLSSFGMFASLHRLYVARIDSPRQLESLFTWSEGIKSLRSLEFNNCDLSMITPSSTRNLKKLISLGIYGCYLTTQTLKAVTNIINLKIFTILYPNCLLGQLPSAIGNMSNLERLLIEGYQFSGPIPHEVGALKKLKSMVLTYTGLSGKIPSTIANLTQLSELQLEDNHLSGRIPSTIANLTQLTQLQLDGNFLTGEIPTSLFTLPALSFLDLSENQLCGPILEFNGASSHLNTVYLQDNELTGQIPHSLLVLPNLIGLDISGNNLMGSVDLDLLWKLENLTSLFLSHNKLTVMEGESDNSSSVYPSQLVDLGLASCNITKIPKLLVHLNNVNYLDLSSNKINGDIPKWIWERWSNNLTAVNMSHNMFTSMELNSSVIPCNRLRILDLSSNRLQGQVPMPVSSAQLLDYSNNAFTSLLQNFTSYLTFTSYLRLSNNNISSHLPHSICGSPSLEVLDLSYNNFAGLVPPCMIDNGILRIINLRENQFKGMLPSNISSACSLQTIDLHGNRIEGQLPRALSNCTDLEILDLGRNKIADTFPSWLGRLLNLRVLVLRSNQFHGSIGYLKDEKLGDQFASLQIIDLASNNFSGELHPHWFENLKSLKKYNNTGQIIGHGNLTSFNGLYQDSVTISYKGFMVTFERILTTLTAIDISDNALEGIIPASIGNLYSLHVLNLSHNAFSEEIPSQLGSITALESLDLSSNMLSGEIPQELTDLTFLSILNLSNNQLVGRIPQSNQFTTFLNSSFDGNVGLCGPPLSKPCDTRTDTPSEEHHKTGSVDVVLFLFSGVGFGVGFAIAILVKQDWMWRWFHIIRIRIL